MKALIASCLLLLPLSAGARMGADHRPPKVLVGEVAPDLPLEGDKNHATLSTFHGKPVLIHLWATWCGPCKVSMPEFRRVVMQYQKTDLVVLMMDRDHSPLDVRQFLMTQQVPWPDYHDESGRFMKTFGGSAIPSTVLIDRDGIVRYHHTGEGVTEKSEGRLIKAINRALTRPVGAPAEPADNDS